ncbi:hypothetical protein A2880_02805 [Candidatus Peribacteria bacterium RIFCSPHIGHO2_01_FULL_49_38]|nr:MAG: hypothetical protein A2880_02805 [Candidatus Peribacteria bacterium RIFCSPHIGHO2_01_FULL_49_38]
MYCANCGAKVKEGAGFCNSCGTRVNGAVAVPIAVDIPTGIRRLWSGRLGRLHYFFGSLLAAAPLFILLSLFGVVRLLQNTFAADATAAAAGDSMALISALVNYLIGLLIGVAIIFSFLFHTTLAIRRCHDFNFTGWLSLCTYIPYLGAIFALGLLFTRGTDGSNQYGPPPVQRGVWADIFNYS